MISKLSNSSLLSKGYYKNMLVGNEAFSPGAYELISTASGTGSSSTISFSSIPSTYKHLQIRWTAFVTTSSDTMSMRFNGDSGGNYTLHRLYSTGSATGSQGFTGFTEIDMSSIAATSTTYNAGIMDIADYASTSKYKTIKEFLRNSNNQIYLESGLWLNTSAISSIAVRTPTQPFSTTTRVSLYGIKG